MIGPNINDRGSRVALLELIATKQDGNPRKWLLNPDFETDDLSALIASAVNREDTLEFLESRLNYYIKQLTRAARVVEQLREEADAKTI